MEFLCKAHEIYIMTLWLIPQSRVLCEKLTVPASRGMSRIFWSSNINYRINKVLPLVPTPTLSSLPISYFFQIHFSNTVSSKLRSSKYFVSYMFSPPNPACISHIPIRATWAAHLIFLDVITQWYWFRSTVEQMVMFIVRQFHLQLSLLNPT